MQFDNEKHPFYTQLLFISFKHAIFLDLLKNKFGFLEQITEWIV